MHHRRLEVRLVASWDPTQRKVAVPVLPPLHAARVEVVKSLVVEVRLVGGKCSKGREEGHHVRLPVLQ